MTMKFADWYDTDYCKWKKHLYGCKYDKYDKYEKKIRHLEEAMTYYGYQTGSITSNTVIYPDQWVYQTAVTQTVTYPNNIAAGIGNYITNYITSFTVAATDFPPETEEQRLEREQRQRDEKAKDDARRKRAREALLSVLTEAQRDQLEKEQHFDLQVNSRLYRVRPGCRVERLDPQTKTIQSYFCIHPASEHGLPSDDVALAQKLLLESNETEFIRTANETKAMPVTPNVTPDEIVVTANEIITATATLELAA